MPIKAIKDDGIKIYLPSESAHLFKEGEYYCHAKYRDYKDWDGIELLSEYETEDGDLGVIAVKFVPVDEVYERITLEALERCCESQHPVYIYDPNDNSLSHTGYWSIPNKSALINSEIEEIPLPFEKEEDYYIDIL